MSAQSQVEIQEAETSRVQGEAKSLMQTITDIVVTNDDEYDGAAVWLKKCANMRKRVKDFFAPMVKAAHEAHKALKAKENESVEPIQKAERHLSRIMGEYQQACEKERRIQEELQRAAEREEQEDETIEIAEGYEAIGRPDLAEAALSSPLPASNVKVESFAPKVAGTVSRVTWSHVIEDEKLIPREYLMVDEKKIAAVVRAMKDATNIPGVRVVSTTAVHARG